MFHVYHGQNRGSAVGKCFWTIIIGKDTMLTLCFSHVQSVFPLDFQRMTRIRLLTESCANPSREINLMLLLRIYVKKVINFTFWNIAKRSIRLLSREGLVQDSVSSLILVILWKSRGNTDCTWLQQRVNIGSLPIILVQKHLPTANPRFCQWYTWNKYSIFY